MIRTLVFSFVVLATACSPSTTGGSGGSGESPADATDAPPDVPDPPPPPPPPPPIQSPGTAMDVPSAAGRVTAGPYTLDLVVGGAPRGRGGDGTHTLDAAPVLR